MDLQELHSDIEYAKKLQELLNDVTLLPKKWKLKNMRNSYAVCASMKIVYYT